MLDHVSRPDVFAALHAPLVQGYALDALEARRRAHAVGRGRAEAFLGRRVTARALRSATASASAATSASPSDGVGGAGLVAGDELVQLTAFAGQRPRGRDGLGPRPQSHPAPSRRRTA